PSYPDERFPVARDPPNAPLPRDSDLRPRPGLPTFSPAGAGGGCLAVAELQELGGYRSRLHFRGSGSRRSRCALPLAPITIGVRLQLVGVLHSHTHTPH